MDSANIVGYKFMCRFSCRKYLSTSFFRIFSLLGSLLLLVSCGSFELHEEREINDIQRVQIGQKTTLILPSNQLFYSKTANLKSNAYDMLNAVVLYLDTHRVGHVAIFGHENGFDNEQLNIDLSQAQAQKIAKFLMDHSQSPVWIQTNGSGSGKPLMVRSLSKHSGERNRYVSIHFDDVHGALQ